MEYRVRPLLAVLLSGLVLIAWATLAPRFFGMPHPLPPGARAEPPALAQAGADPAPVAQTTVQAAPRVRITTRLLSGSLSLRGLRFDDLVLLRHRATADRASPPVRLLAPTSTQQGYLAEFGWTGDPTMVPSSSALWSADRNSLDPNHPVTLRWDNEKGATFVVKLEVDDQYMFRIVRRVENQGASVLKAAPYNLISRRGPGQDPSTWTIHTGPIGTFGNRTDYSVSYGDLDKASQSRSSIGGWLGFGDKYWLTALIPDQRTRWDGTFTNDRGWYIARWTTEPTTLPPGAAVTTSDRFFAGSKEVSLLQAYEADGIPHFDGAIDWGWFVWFEKPLFYVLNILFSALGNFGLAIIALTVVVRLILFPLAHKQFASMAAMRRLQPKLELLKERHRDDKSKLQQEMLRLYSEEGASPFSGCLPMLVQMPIFFALYKVLTLSTEMRHQPFVLWITDLSAPDPLTPFNLFGVLPFNPPGVLHIGVLALLLGATMWLQMRLAPVPADPVQQQMSKIMPLFMTVIFAPLAAGLQLYYVCNNLISLLQQRMLMHSAGGERKAAKGAFQIKRKPQRVPSKL